MKVNKLLLKYPIDIGAPTPKVLASEAFLMLFYFADQQSDEKNKILIERDVISDRGVAFIEFESYLNFKFGSPNDEVLYGHPYFNLGLRSYSFFEIQDSDWIAEVIKINSVHPRHSQDLFKDYKHFILTFHDSMFECIAKNYKLSFSNKSMGELISKQVESLILTH